MPQELVGKKILLVDDDPDILQSLKLALGETGAALETASDGNTAVEKSAAFAPDLVILDMMLPKRSGFLVVQSIKKGRAKNEAPRIIMVTGNLGGRHKVFAESLGVSAYMTKPFRIDRLMEKILELLGNNG
jgi:DNA-binding response OmpR family regulator